MSAHIEEYWMDLPVSKEQDGVTQDLARSLKVSPLRDRNVKGLRRRPSPHEKVPRHLLTSKDVRLAGNHSPSRLAGAAPVDVLGLRGCRGRRTGRLEHHITPDVEERLENSWLSPTCPHGQQSLGRPETRSAGTLAPGMRPRSRGSGTRPPISWIRRQRGLKARCARERDRPGALSTGRCCAVGKTSMPRR